MHLEEVVAGDPAVAEEEAMMVDLSDQAAALEEGRLVDHCPRHHSSH